MKSNDQSINNLNTYLSVLSLIVAVAALYFTYELHVEREENLYLDFDINTRDDYPVKLIATEFSRIPASLQSQWELVIGNKSDRDISIISVELYRLVSDSRWTYDFIRGMKTEYDNPLYFTAVNSNEEYAFNVPFSIKAGHSKKFTLGVTFPVAIEAYNTLDELLNLEEKYSLRKLRFALCNKNLDFMGNYVQCAGGPSGHNPKKEHISYTYQLLLQSSRGNIFTFEETVIHF